MHPLLERALGDPRPGPGAMAHLRPLLLRLLAPGPWCWPPAEEPVAAARAAEITGCSPARAPGRMLLLSVGNDRPSLAALLTAGQAPPTGEPSLPFGDAARAAWSAATHALGASLPLVWRVPDEAAAPPTAWFLSALPRPPAPELAPGTLLDGDSYGLAFLLALASAVLEIPLPEDAAATAGLDDTGRTAPVDGLGPKLAILARHAPRVRRLLVHPSQVAAARAAALAAAARIDILPVETAHSAIVLLLDPVAEFARGGSDPATRQRRLRSLANLAFLERKALREWLPVARAAELALASWAPSAEERVDLEIARAVARRHTSNQGEFPWRLVQPRLDRYPRPHRLQLLRHAAQQAADTGAPSPDDVERESLRHLRPGTEAEPSDLKLQGALGRMFAARGRLVEALAHQRAAVDGWLALREGAEASYGLSEWFRLAGVLGLPEEAAAAGERLQRTAEAPGLDATGAAYVEVARAQALRLLGRALPLDRLEALLTDREVKARNLPPRAARLLVWAYRDRGATAAAERVLAQLRAWAAGRGDIAFPARKNLALAELDRAVAAAAGDHEPQAERLAEAALAGLVAEERPLYQQLLATCDDASALGQARHLTRYYPY